MGRRGAGQRSLHVASVRVAPRGLSGQAEAEAAHAGLGGEGCAMAAGGTDGGAQGASPESERAPTRAERQAAATVSAKKRKASLDAATKATAREKYARAPDDAKGVTTAKMRDKKLKGQVKSQEKKFAAAARQAALIERWLLPSEAGSLEADGPLERTWRFKQDDIRAAVDRASARKAFELTLQGGPYRVDLTRSGRYALLAGHKGQLAVMDWSRHHAVTELDVRETVHDGVFLHNERFFAAAQRKYTYIYDQRGIEIHCLKKHAGATRLTFLPHHYLLASVGSKGVLTYQDTTCGEVVAQHRTKSGACDCLALNPWNQVSVLGHQNGTVSLWTPNMPAAVAKVLTHRGNVLAAAVDPHGRYLVTAGIDRQVAVWDVRTYAKLHAYQVPTPATALEVSQRGVLALAYGPHVQLWKDALVEKAQAPYLRHSYPGRGAIHDVAFVPYEDVLFCGHGSGAGTVLAPGVGEPNFDSFVANPYETKKQRREQEVHQLLDKLPPKTIQLDPDRIGTVQKEAKEEQIERQRAAAEANRSTNVKRKTEEQDTKTKRVKGRNRASRRFKRKQQNVVDVARFQAEAKAEALVKKAEREKEALKERQQRQAGAMGDSAALSKLWGKR